MKILSWFLYTLATLLIIVAAAAGVYVCVYQGWFLGIVGGIEAAKVTPIETTQLAGVSSGCSSVPQQGH